MKKSLGRGVFDDIALEIGVDPSFIEKDWYAVQLLALIAELQKTKDVKMVFSGGTSLSKGHGLIKRFSEDLDFILAIPEGLSLNAGQRRAFRKEVVAAIQSDERFAIDEDKILRGDSHRFFKIPIQYNKTFDAPFLRPHLQLEMTFMGLKRPAERLSICSMASEMAKADPELEIICVSALETAGDKLSALTWRVLVRDRDDDKDDPTIIRHLHDLAALEGMISEDPDDFILSASESLEQDKNRRGGDVVANMAVGDRLAGALKILKEDALYSKEYEQFVASMSYAADDEKIGFDDAVQALARIIVTYFQ